MPFRGFGGPSMSEGGKRSAGLTANSVKHARPRGRPTSCPIAMASVATFGNVASLRAALAAVVYRGGTSLAGLDAVTLPPATQCVIVFDGIVTIDLGIEFAPDCALSILTSSKMADGSRLGRLAQSTAGRLVRVAEGGAAEAAEALSTRTSGVASERGFVMASGDASLAFHDAGHALDAVAVLPRGRDDPAIRPLAVACRAA